MEGWGSSSKRKVGAEGRMGASSVSSAGAGGRLKAVLPSSIHSCMCYGRATGMHNSCQDGAKRYRTVGISAESVYYGQNIGLNFDAPCIIQLRINLIESALDIKQ